MIRGTAREALLHWIVLGFAGGITLNEMTWNSVAVRTVPFYVIIAAVLVAAVFLVVFPKSAVVILVFAVFCSIGAGFLRNYLVLSLDGRPTTLDWFAGEKISFVGVMTDEQERRDFNTRLVVQVREIENGEAEKAKVLVTTSNPKEFRYGDVVRVKGKLTLPENFYTDTGREFDYVGYLRAGDIRFLVKNASVEAIGRNPPSKILAGLFFAKRAFVESLAKMLPEPQSSLAAGILIDGKQSINGELQEKFRKTGLVHIVVLSGYNVSIVAEAIGRAFMFLPRFAGLLSASIGVIAFAMITGASATVVRASIMAILVLLSRMSLRNYDPVRGLFIASFLMLVQNPAILLHSPSFQLSFLATFAVVKIVPIFEKRAKFIPERFGLRDLVVSNIIVQIFLFPILSWMTGFFSAVSLPANLLVLPLIPLTMLAGFLTAVSGFLSHIVALPPAFLSHILLSYELAIVNFFSKFSLAEIPLGGFSGWLVAVFYIVALLLTKYLKGIA